MTTVPLGVGAYKRTFGDEPEIRLENRFLEKNPTNLREHISLISRPGTNKLNDFAGGLIRRNFSKQGLFGGDLFVVSGQNLWRYNAAGVRTQIVGVINGVGIPTIAWMKGIGYEKMFISDGLLLQVYQGGTHATGTLTASGAITNQVIQIGGAYYSWNAAVDNNAPDGTSSHPWLAKLGGTTAASLENMSKLINFDGVRGVDFSTALGGPSPFYSADFTATTLVITATSEYADGNTISTTVFSGANLAWGATTLLGGGTHALNGVPVPDGVGIQALASLSSHVLASVANSQKCFFILPGEITIDPVNFFSKESNPDNIVDMVTVGDQALISGNGSSESWYASGDPEVPFLPTEGRVYQRGVLDGTTVVVNDAVILVGDDGVVYEISGGAVQPISDHGIEERIRKQRRREQGLTP